MPGDQWGPKTSMRTTAGYMYSRSQFSLPANGPASIPHGAPGLLHHWKPGPGHVLPPNAGGGLLHTRERVPLQGWLHGDHGDHPPSIGAWVRVRNVVMEHRPGYGSGIRKSQVSKVGTAPAAAAV
jgi:hypothetical protein